MTITETVLIVNKNGACHASEPCLVEREQQAVVHVIEVHTAPLSRGALRSAVRSRRDEIVGRYAQTCSHSIAYGRNVAVLAVRMKGPVGIDVEPLSIEPRAHIAEHYFTPEEQAFLQAIEDRASREAAFRHLWVCKEAALKCAGGTVPANLSDVWIEDLTQVSEAGRVALVWGKHFADEKGHPHSGVLFQPCIGHIGAVVL